MGQRVIAIIQARMGSTRLPGKVMRPLAGRPMLAHVVERAQRIPGVHRVVVATSTLPSDDALAEYAASLPGAGVFRGSETDVLARYHGAAVQYSADVVMRITSDCPLISPAVSGQVLARFLESPDAYDYVTNTIVRTYPRGLDTEVFPISSLKTAFLEATEEPDREHVTPYIWRQPGRFRCLDVLDTEDRHQMRWTVDTPEDFELVTRIYDALFAERPAFDYEDVLSLLSLHPEWLDLNRHIEQKLVPA